MGFVVTNPQFRHITFSNNSVLRTAGRALTREDDELQLQLFSQQPFRVLSQSAYGWTAPLALIMDLLFTGRNRANGPIIRQNGVDTSRQQILEIMKGWEFVKYQTCFCWIFSMEVGRGACGISFLKCQKNLPGFL